MNVFGSDTDKAISPLFLIFGYAAGRILDRFDEYSYMASHTELLDTFGNDRAAANATLCGNRIR